MNDILNKPYVLLLLSVISLFLTIMLFSNISDVIIQASKSTESRSNNFQSEQFKVIDQALKEIVVQNFFNYVGDFENPFKKSPFSSNISSEKRVSNVTVSDRIQLKLKGILSNERPLAILEDNEGRTFIRGVGDSVESQRISAISGSVVTILDGKKKYEITVKEE